MRRNAHTLSKPMVSCREGAEYRWSEGSMSWSTAKKERRATLERDFLWIIYCRLKRVGGGKKEKKEGR